MKKYTQEMKAFIEDNVWGRTTAELTSLVNTEFGEFVTVAMMKNFKSRHKLKSGLPKGVPVRNSSNLYPLEVREFIQQNYIGTGPKAMVDLLNVKFSSNYTAQQIKSYYGRFKLNSGLDGRFAKGSIPANKGMKGFVAPGSEKGWFKKGNLPVNHKPVGSTRIDSKDGYLLVKIKEPNVWALAHKILWEQVNGKVPKGCIITFLDGDKTNITIENLALISMAESLMLNRKGLRSTDANITKTGILVVKLGVAINKKSKKEDMSNV